ncbi:MAG: hypothetical protein EXR07_02985 [Acetobacteraceae bacterium]|nr:hypothetical protein [Acetobacteraceae bacterium]
MTETRFRRLVLELGHGAADPATISAAASFARILGLDLFALFVEDEALLRVSDLPFTREISPVTFRWRPLQAGQLEIDLRATADRARRHLAAAARATGIRQSFQVYRGDPGSHVIETCVATDIVVVSPPRRVEGDTAHGYQVLRETARLSAASVLWLPPAAVPRSGPIVAVAADPDDPGLGVARRVADQTRERLVVLMPEAAIGDAVAVRPLRGESLQDLAATLDDVKERLIVMSRAGPLGDMGARVSVQRGVPVLVVE